jgi:hypothetical protein
VIDHLSICGSTIHVHTSEVSLKSTKAFTNGSIVIDRDARTMTFAKLPPVPLPAAMAVAKGAALDLQLVAPDGSLKRQTRTIVLTANEKYPEILRTSGRSTQLAKFSAADGWGIVVYKFRAYFTHPGVETSGEVPQWLKESIARQKALWNRLAWLCWDARRKCSPVPTEEVQQFVSDVILPAIDAYNVALGRERTKEKIKHPVKLKKEAPGLDGVWSFIGSLRKRIEEGRAVPEGLLDQAVAFASQFTADYTPLNDFLNAIDQIADRESHALVMEKDGDPIALKPFEIRPVVKSFKAVIAMRKSVKSAWSDGWPLLKYPDSPNADSWGLHYYFNKAGVEAELLTTPKGLPGLTFGEPLGVARTGHPQMNASKRRASKRSLRAAEISVSGYNKERWNFRFAVLQHRELPVGSHVKEWKLIFKEGKLWLCLVVELQRRVVAAGPVAAGLDVGWRRTESGIRFGTLYEPQSHTFRELEMDLQRSPVDTPFRTPFRIDLGPTRWEQRHITKLLPEWKPGDPIPGCFEMRAMLGTRRSTLVKELRASLKEYLGERCPAWIDKAGETGLLKLKELFKDDAGLLEMLNRWSVEYDAMSDVVSSFFDRSTKRIEYGHMQVAHDVCRFLQAKGTNHLIVETAFIAKASQKHDNEDHTSLKQSQKYRQFAAVSKFVQSLKSIAPQYGLVVDARSAANTTRVCHHCGHLNPATEKEATGCQGCGMLIYQDQNAAINLSRSESEPEISEIAA